MRIGLTQRVEIVPGRDERRDGLDQAWSALVLDLGFLPVPLPNRVEDVEAFLAPLALEGFILTGGNDLERFAPGSAAAPERDRLEHKILDWSAARRLPVLGVCRGLQMIVTHWGGTLRELSGHVATRHALDVVNEPALPLANRDAVNSFHRFGALRADLGATCRAVALAPDTSVEAVAHAELPQWGVMWHPERAPFDPRDRELLRVLFRSERS